MNEVYECPFCHSQDLMLGGDGTQMFGRDLHLIVECNKCGGTWTVIAEPVGVIFDE